MAKARWTVRTILLLLAVATIVNLARVGWTPKYLLVSFLVLGGLILVERKFHAEMDRLTVNSDGEADSGLSEDSVRSALRHLPLGTVVLHDVSTPSGHIAHLVFRENGTIFLIETKSHRGRVPEERLKAFVEQTHEKIFWLHEFLKEQTGVDASVNAVVVFPNSYVSVQRRIRGVDILRARRLCCWIEEARGNPSISHKLWNQIDKVKENLAPHEIAEYVEAVP